HALRAPGPLRGAVARRHGFADRARRSGIVIDEPGRDRRLQRCGGSWRGAGLQRGSWSWRGAGLQRTGRRTSLRSLSLLAASEIEQLARRLVGTGILFAVR